MENENKAHFGLIVLSFFIVYIVWGTTYLANAWGVDTVPPFVFAAARFTLAGLLLLGLCRVFQPINVTKVQLKNTAIAGFLLFAIGNGFVVWALQYVDSGICSLVIACEPMIVALMLWQFKDKRPIWLTWLGIFMGLIGMGLLIGQPQLSNNPSFWAGIGAIVIGLVAWGYVSIWLPDADFPKNTFQSAGFQMFFGGIILFVLSFLLGEWQSLGTVELDHRVIGAYVYLVIFGSILAFSAFTFLLKNVPPTKVVTSSYVHPVIALFLGWYLNDEIVHSQSLFAAMILLISVFFINKAKEQA